MKPLAYYQQQIEKGAIKEDAEQLQCMQKFDALYTAISQQSWLDKLLKRPLKLQGLYLWGGVGIGKTFLMDCFYNQLPLKRKLRLHFHQFMAMVHDRINEFHHHPDPIKHVAKRIIKKAQVLCFDEFYVAEITDAMILGRLFHYLFKAGLVVITTSNIAHDELYKNGLQRQNFLSTIALLKDKLEEIHLTSTVDYRQHFSKDQFFLSPLNHQTKQTLNTYFEQYGETRAPNQSNTILILKRPIAVKKLAKTCVWFDFYALCDIPRSQRDYLALSKRFKTIIISDIPQLKASDRNLIRNFINLIDIFYDKKVRLILSSAVKIDKIYTKGPLVFDFARTLSRLTEMQAPAYYEE